jgi:hypothetical protein
VADKRIPRRTLEMKLSGRRPRGRPRTRWMDQVMRDVEKRGKKWMQVIQDRDRWTFICNSRPKKLETTKGRRSSSFVILQRQFWSKFNKQKAPSRSAISYLVQKCELTGSIYDNR